MKLEKEILLWLDNDWYHLRQELLELYTSGALTNDVIYDMLKETGEIGSLAMPLVSLDHIRHSLIKDFDDELAE